MRISKLLKVALTSWLILLPVFGISQDTPKQERVVGPTENDLVLTVRLSPGVTAESLDLINQMTEPRVVRLQTHENAGAVLARLYGAFLPRIEGQVRAANPWLLTDDLKTVVTTVPRDLELPAGAEYYSNVVKPIFAGTDLNTQAKLETGYASKDLLSQIRKTTESFKHYFKNYCRTHTCTVLAKTTLASQRAIAFPFVSRYVSFRLRSEAKENATALLSRLRTDPAVLDAEIHSPATLISPVNYRVLAGLSSECGAQPTNPDWFINSVSLNKLPLETLRGHNPAIIAVMDSGIAPNDTRFTLWENIAEANGMLTVDDDLNGYVDDTIGCNFIMQSDFPIDDQFSEKYRNHGTHVLGLASGRFLAEPLATAVTQRVRGMVLKIADSQGYVDYGAVNDAIVYAKSKNAPIVNMSFVGQFSASIKRYIKEDSSRLYVVAAGNGGIRERGLDLDLASVRVFPAKLGAELDNVITVAAHNEDGSLACFSNFGKSAVDLAAPGVAIQSTIADGELANLSGTSQAAPLVSLTAALLYSQGVLEPALIKQRILISVDVMGSYQGRVASEGKLNIAKAVSIFDDVVELNDSENTLLRGKLVSPPTEVKVGDKTIPFRAIRKVVNLSTEDGPPVQQIIWLNQGKLERLNGKLEISKLILRVGDTCLELAPDNIRDLIPAWRSSGQAVACRQPQ